MAIRSLSTKRLSHGMRSTIAATVGEFVGTWLFLFMSFAGTQFANTNQLSSKGAQTPAADTVLYISLAFGFSLMVNVWVFARISGSHFNPAVTFAMLLNGSISWGRAACYVVAQLMAGITSAAMVTGLFPGSLAVATTLDTSTRPVQGLFIEMFLTAQLVFTIFMLAAEKYEGSFIAPIGIGLALFICELTGVHFTGGSLNPARSFGPAVVLGSFPTYHWIYWLGPVMGSLVATGFYRFIKALQAEASEGGQGGNSTTVEEIDLERDGAGHGAVVADKRALTVTVSRQ